MSNIKYTKQELKENRKKWCDLLESGEFTQAVGQLQTGPNCFCGLGLAVEAWSRATGGITPKEVYCGEVVLYGASLKCYPVIQAWLGLKTSVGRYTTKDWNTKTLVDDNDDEGLSLKEISEIVKSEPEGLFID